MDIGLTSVSMFADSNDATASNAIKNRASREESTITDNRVKTSDHSRGSTPNTMTNNDINPRKYNTRRASATLEDTKRQPERGLKNYGDHDVEPSTPLPPLQVTLLMRELGDEQ